MLKMGILAEMGKSTSLTPVLFEAEKTSARGLSNVQLPDVTDRNHLTGSFAESLIPALEMWVLPILNPHIAARDSKVLNPDLERVSSARDAQ
ncbi:MAG: hypothetical protein DMG31_14975 [Acidobacteria bacterium]|nr:MAG: hypothetical protein DMG31_14975 [Acidobacteriota bacterium]